VDGRPLADAVVALADTPDQLADVEQRLTRIAWLAAERVAVADYASVTTLRGEEYTNVAATSELAAAVDEAQFGERAGPCLEALESGEAVAVPNTATTMRWPDFQKVAPDFGLRASVSIPLFTGWGAPIAVLNLYGRDRAAMAPLVLSVGQLYATSRELNLSISPPPVLDPGATELLAGYAEVLTLRATVRLAMGALAGRTGGSLGDAYAALRCRAADHHTSLSKAATAVLKDKGLTDKG
jgi:hypothetical protein